MRMCVRVLLKASHDCSMAKPLLVVTENTGIACVIKINHSCETAILHTGGCSVIFVATFFRKSYGGGTSPEHRQVAPRFKRPSLRLSSSNRTAFVVLVSASSVVAIHPSSTKVSITEVQKL